MRPVDQKLKYQIDKLMRAAVTGSLSENDPLRFKPNPQNLMSKVRLRCFELWISATYNAASFILQMINLVIAFCFCFCWQLQLEESDQEELGSDENEGGESKKSHSKVKKYVPPRLAPVHYGKKKRFCMALM